MDEFILNFDRDKFKSTNSLWNDLRLRDPWSVGYVTILIEMKTFNSKEEWENYYYETGLERETKIKELQNTLQEKLNDELLSLTNEREIYDMSWDLKNLNLNYGRTKERLHRKGEILHENAVKKGLNITLVECIEAVRFRTICQTWNGIILRERNTVSVLKNKFSTLEFISTNGDFDYKYAVDYELKKNGELICGIQIKPKSYLGNVPYLIKAQNANLRKNRLYTDEFGVPVYNVISKREGEIINHEVINKIQELTH